MGGKGKGKEGDLIGTGAFYLSHSIVPPNKYTKQKIWSSDLFIHVLGIIIAEFQEVTMVTSLNKTI
jgi:hypothetical protein